MPLPNNIGLDGQSQLARQIASYQTKFYKWWRERGPTEFLDRQMRIRRPTGSVNGVDWAEYSSMRPDEYRWGIFMVPTGQDAIAFGDHQGKKVWEEVPGEYRTLLLQHICVQADVENAAVEQSRTLTQTAPSEPDLENVFQFFLEEGRHTWSMVHLLLAHFGADGVVEAEALLERMSGDPKNPRLLEAFNYPTEDWLSHFMWCFLADRVGKYQIQAVTESSFAPLARAAKFMMFEEPLHISFGAVGLDRVLARTAEVTLREGTLETFAAGAIPFPVIQRYLNYWAPKVFDLFGNDDSERSHELFRAGLRRPRNFVGGESQIVPIDARVGDRVAVTEVAGEWATNAIMRRQFIAEVQTQVDRWNASLRALGIDFQLRLPHERFSRAYGPCAGLPFDLDGKLLPRGAAVKAAEYFPTSRELANVRSLMQRELTPGQFASWISPAATRLNSLVQGRSAE
ncbi:benzoyl-CoA 2,3-epoxidase subunit BoxB [Corallococcus sp. CA054B]|uniref:Phenylacetic acid catabolic protein n=1 Tax=Corallococcus sp. CA054B TaxID=2316734 RepID=UPI000EA33B7C|nr:Phenylacetic acid catabolic protein [Corallococcus sp. CA054B]RKG65326.1 benzoyl-CoA 2,3-epoxidase subunit BoxB [Corallococcus sp. CA054B]